MPRYGGYVGRTRKCRIRSIEWSLWAFASMRAVRLFLRARAVINFLMRAASTLEITNASPSSDQISHASSEHFRITNGEQRALRKFSSNWNLSLCYNVVLHQVIWLRLSKQDNRRKARQHDKALSRFNHPQYALSKVPFTAKLLHLASRESVGGR